MINKIGFLKLYERIVSYNLFFLGKPMKSNFIITKFYEKRLKTKKKEYVNYDRND